VTASHCQNPFISKEISNQLESTCVASIPAVTGVLWKPGYLTKRFGSVRSPVQIRPPRLVGGWNQGDAGGLPSFGI
jgi:hypothetical protein